MPLTEAQRSRVLLVAGLYPDDAGWLSIEDIDGLAEEFGFESDGLYDPQYNRRLAVELLNTALGRGVTGERAEAMRRQITILRRPPPPATAAAPEGGGTGEPGVDHLARQAAATALAAAEALETDPQPDTRGAPVQVTDALIDQDRGDRAFAWSVSNVIRAITRTVGGLIDGAIGRHDMAGDAHDLEFRSQFNFHNREDAASHADLRALIGGSVANAGIAGTRLTLTRNDGRSINLNLPTSGMAVADGVIQTAVLDPDTETITITTSTGATVNLDLSPGLLKYALDTDIDPLVQDIGYSANGLDLVLTKQNGDVITRPFPAQLRVAQWAQAANNERMPYAKSAQEVVDHIADASQHGGDSGTIVVGNPSGQATENWGKLSIGGVVGRIGARLNPSGQRRANTQLTSLRVITDTGATQDGIIAGPDGAVEGNRGGLANLGRLQTLVIADQNYELNDLFIRGEAPVAETLYRVGDCPLVYGYRYLVVVAGSYTRDELISGGGARLIDSPIRDGYDVARTDLQNGLTTHGGVVYSRSGTGAGVEPGSENTDTIWRRLVTGRRVEDFPAVAQAQHAITYYHDRLGAAIRRAGDATRAILVPSALPSNYGDEARGYVEEFILGRAPRKLGRWATDQPTGLIDLYERQVGEMFVMRLVLDATSPLNDPIQIRLRVQHGTEAQRTRDLFPEVGNPQAYVSAQYADRHFDNTGAEYFVGFRRQQDGATYHDVHPGDAIANLLDSASINTELSDIESDLAHVDFWLPRVMTQAQYDALSADEQARGVVIIDPGA